MSVSEKIDNYIAAHGGNLRNALNASMARNEVLANTLEATNAWAAQLEAALFAAEPLWKQGSPALYRQCKMALEGVTDEDIWETAPDEPTYK